MDALQLPALSIAALALPSALLPQEAGPDAPFAEYRGTYDSSHNGGCALTLYENEVFSMKCTARLPITGLAFFSEGAFVFSTQHPVPLSLVPRPTSSRGALPSWPPSLRDPTAPLVLGGPGSYESRSPDYMRLTPLRWGARTYLIRDGTNDDFCRAVQAGKEPRKTSEGDAFLKSGDHRNAVEGKAPSFCGTLK